MNDGKNDFTKYHEAKSRVDAWVSWAAVAVAVICLALIVLIGGCVEAAYHHSVNWIVTDVPDWLYF